jgi:hypothetical protein
MLWASLTAAALAGGYLRTLQLSDPHKYLVHAWPYGSAPMNLIAYTVALYFCLKIAADHPHSSTMRLAWLLIAASAVMSLIRHGFECLTFLTGWAETRLTTLTSLRQIPIALSLVLLTAGLVILWSSFAAIGLGLRFRRSDVVWIIVILAFVPSIFSLRENLADSRSAYALIRHIQSASPLLLAAPALVGLALHRTSQEMGGGQLATSLRFMVVFLLLRLFALLVSVSPGLAGIPGIAVGAQAAGWAAPWLFPLAAVHRWRLTIAASNLADRYESNPEEEIAELFAGTRQRSS